MEASSVNKILLIKKDLKFLVPTKICLVAREPVLIVCGRDTTAVHVMFAIKNCVNKFHFVG